MHYVHRCLREQSLLKQAVIYKLPHIFLLPFLLAFQQQSFKPHADSLMLPTLVMCFNTQFWTSLFYLFLRSFLLHKRVFLCLVLMMGR